MFFFARQGDFWIRKCSEPVPFNGAKGLDSTQGTKEKQSGRNLKSEMLDAISQIAVALGVLTSNVGKKVATALLAASAFQGTSTCLAASGSKYCSRKHQFVGVRSRSSRRGVGVRVGVGVEVVVRVAVAVAVSVSGKQ